MKKKILDKLQSSDGYVSGQELCELLGVSRTAVWKNIQALKNDGYVIEGVNNKGYRLVSEPQQTAEISADEIVTVEFDNTYDHGLNPGYGVTNHFDYDEDEGWQWTQLPDNSVKEE